MGMRHLDAYIKGTPSFLYKVHIDQHYRLLHAFVLSHLPGLEQVQEKLVLSSSEREVVYHQQDAKGIPLWL